MKRFIFLPLLFALMILPTGYNNYPRNEAIRIQSPDKKEITTDDYDKFEYRIPMRDGVELFTSVYIPKDRSRKYPILMTRTPYSVGPYGKDKKASLHHSQLFINEKFIFVFQDVRGQFMSEGKFVNMRPELDNDTESKTQIDESTDAWDTVDWLIKNIPDNNGKVGIWGSSYPGFYSATAAIHAHPAIKAVSPQAPIADWFFDDFHHHGAFFLPYFGFLYSFGQPHTQPTTHKGKRFEYGTPDGYHFYLNKLGALSNVNSKFFHNNIDFWNKIVEHPNYDDFWQKRNLLPHLKNIKPAVLIVGGWYDAEDLYGTLNVYSTIEKNNPNTVNSIVMGPWQHGGWIKTLGDHLGNVMFSTDPDPSTYYQEHIEFPFFMHYLKDKKDPRLAEAIMYDPGLNKWEEFDQWPPANLEKTRLYLRGDGTLEHTSQSQGQAYREFISDPNKPVPFTEDIAIGMTRKYMTDDQRFASRRPDVLTYQTDVLHQDVTLAGKSIANLYISISQTDADWVVKLIDVYPDDAKDNQFTSDHQHMAGYEQMVRSEVIRGRFRNSYEKPEPFVPMKVTQVRFPLQDVLHTFKKGHRIMIQVQSTWFPLVDRNPQKYVANIFEAKDSDFVPSINRVWSKGEEASFIEVGILKQVKNYPHDCGPSVPMDEK